MKMGKKEKIQKNQLEPNQDLDFEQKYEILKKKTIKQLIAPAGIDASNIDHLEIISDTTRYARSFFVADLPRIATFPYLFRSMYEFGDINTSVYINPIQESISQTKLNKNIN